MDSTRNASLAQNNEVIQEIGYCERNLLNCTGDVQH